MADTRRAKGYGNSEDGREGEHRPSHSVTQFSLSASSSSSSSSSPPPFFLLFQRLPPPIITTFAPTGADLSSTFVEGLRFRPPPHAHPTFFLCFLASFLACSLALLEFLLLVISCSIARTDRRGEREGGGRKKGVGVINSSSEICGGYDARFLTIGTLEKGNKINVYREHDIPSATPADGTRRFKRLSAPTRPPTSI